MKKLLALTFYLALISVSSCSDAQSSKDNKAVKKNQSTDKVSQLDTSATIKNVSPSEFKILIDKGDGIILDVRTPEEVSNNHISNASFINFYDEDFKAKVSVMQKSKPIYVYCKGGGRSAHAAEILIENGFKKVYNLTGGIMAWEHSGNPVVEYDNLIDEGAKAMNSKDFNSFLSENEVVLVDFHTKWCSPCKAMAPIVDDIESEYQGKAGIMRVDLDKSKALGKEHKITGVPVFVVFKSGKEVWRTAGKVERQVLVEAINSAL